MLRSFVITLAFAGLSASIIMPAAAQTAPGYGSGGTAPAGGSAAAPSGGAAPAVTVAPAPPAVTVVPAEPVRPGTRIYTTGPNPEAVYIAPKNCGVYRYWNGSECVDARDDPPALDRERPIR